MREIKTVNGVMIKAESKAIEVSWTITVVRDDNTIVAAAPFNRAYGQYDREQFLADMADEQTAVTYADLAGLEVRPVVEPQHLTE